MRCAMSEKITPEQAREVLEQEERQKAEAKQIAAQACWAEIEQVLKKHKAQLVQNIMWQQNGTSVPTLSIEADAEQ